MATQSNVIQIVARRADQPDGIGDYATHLAVVMAERHGCISSFISGTPATTEPARNDAWHTEPVFAREGDMFAGHLTRMCREQQAAAVILHVSGYGYQKRGVPFWLLEGMRKWRSKHPNICLIGIFHELFATGKIWNSSFWLSRAQLYVTRELWQLCDRGLTTNDVYFDQMVAWRPEMRSHLSVMPVFSNMGEPEKVLHPDCRPPDMAVFGGAGTEQGIYGSSWLACSAAVAKEFGIRAVLDMGNRISMPPSHLGPATVRGLGCLPQPLVSQHLLACRFGLLNYDIRRLAKSGVFAAYAAHGVIPICIGPEMQTTHDKLEEGVHFLRWPSRKSTEKSTAELSSIQRKLAAWYESHSLARQADLLSSWCVSGGGSRLAMSDALTAS